MLYCLRRESDDAAEVEQLAGALDEIRDHGTSGHKLEQCSSKRIAVPVSRCNCIKDGQEQCKPGEYQQIALAEDLAQRNIREERFRCDSEQAEHYSESHSQ